ncbi:hypothetical protein [Albibacterium bauzanense]|uniref:Uncharacterized protein n=1 Tax=Albibacterium bauzanense TaxID=653929 RepID=A0A4R1M4Z2_9SPHI|nr:hypothetical protein [Albibacterium bauzanense]TCK84803.1 hypothetical protein C8N28_0097 [Albibacterium bauzanense]
MLPFTQHSLHKLEDLLKASNYKIRYEKGNFKSGVCVLLQDKVLVINKFSDIEVKINSLIETIRELDFSNSMLDDKQKKFLYLVKQTKLNL